jgi:hypothetical protein
VSRMPRKLLGKKRAVERVSNQPRPRKKASTTKKQRAAPKAVEPGYRAKVRMYRQGLGDCFLVSLPRTGSDRPFYVLIDCGVLLGTANAAAKMTAVMEHIVLTTGGEIDLLIATHEHWDHLSGFVQAKTSFDKLRVAQVWLGWTEDPADTLTQNLKREKGFALMALRMGLSQLQMGGAAEEAVRLGSILEFFGAARGPTTADALTNVRAKVRAPRYCRPSDEPVVPPGVSARFYVLGPPHDEKSLRKVKPTGSDKETYGLALNVFMEGPGTALRDIDTGHPFDQQYAIPFADGQLPDLPFFRDHYWQPKGTEVDGWRRIDGDWLGGTTEMALQLDSLTNNTSLVLAIELAPGGDVLLFAADAQVGSWLSWQSLSWRVDGTTVTGSDLLNRAIFYKVGHHGSHNATLKEKGLEEMKNLRIAMIPVDHNMAVKKGWGKMPLDELVAALNKRVKSAVLQADKPAPMLAPPEILREDPLFYEVTF